MSQAIILCYHKVGPIAEEGRRLNIEPARLRSHAAFFQKRGYKAVRACDLAGSWPTRTIAFTFDDAYLSTLRYGASVLEELGIRGSFYAVPAHIGGESAWDGDLARPLATWEDLRKAEAEGHEVGNHTMNHRHLSALPLDEQIREIQTADQAMREHGLTPRSFCFPYGSVGTLQALEQAGYGIGLALDKRVATDQDNPLRLPRIVVAYSDSTPMLLYKIYLRPKLRR